MPFDPEDYVSPAVARGMRRGWLDMTQDAWAFVLQVHKMTVSKWERGEAAIPDRCQPWLQLLRNSGKPPRHYVDRAETEARRHFQDPRALTDFWRAVGRSTARDYTRG